ncbi:hypothetical protein [Arthrobacter sp. ERGS1:01]|uniref:hypothetical protein n=1 Tax=Arthrobacter sp. ERGS1:01 TaxID=1704044 RepID=UPI000B089E10|nr:hypothetical protein [Arthrobacter sp. ERGS1:01]
MADVDIVVIDGIRYRKDDAKRRGLLEPEPEAKAEEPKAKAVSNKAANPASK